MQESTVGGGGPPHALFLGHALDLVVEGIDIVATVAAVVIEGHGTTETAVAVGANVLLNGMVVAVVAAVEAQALKRRNCGILTAPPGLCKHTISIFVLMKKTFSSFLVPLVPL